MGKKCWRFASAAGGTAVALILFVQGARADGMHGGVDNFHVGDLHINMGHNLFGPQVVHDGESKLYLAPHHDTFVGHSDHYFQMTGDSHHFAWYSATPATPGPIVIKYDFRTEILGACFGDPTGTNVITPGQIARVVDALDAWSAATMGKVVFVQDTMAPYSDIINIGTCAIDGPGAILGLGGGVATHMGATHSRTFGVAFQDSAETWDEILGNGNPPGTFDYFTVAAQEIGHALALGHTDDDGDSTDDIMDGFYTGEKTPPYSDSPPGDPTDDVSHIVSVYGKTVMGREVPEPTSLTLLGLGAVVTLSRRLRKLWVA